MVSELFLQFASAAPGVALSPASVKTTHLGKQEALPSPSPDSKTKRVALSEPTKRSLQDYEKHLAGHEATLRKGLQELDKATSEFQEAIAVKEAMRERTKQRQEQKRKREQELLAAARRSGRGLVAL